MPLLRILRGGLNQAHPPLRALRPRDLPRQYHRLAWATAALPLAKYLAEVRTAYRPPAPASPVAPCRLRDA
jgi:hypothetical protein